ncbi:hypothetical protein MSAS_34420 [Mycobacterium saskatchewanense]|nr:hypothetical protein MSAS_34420 [Mycobacterium saskatchewanense]
MDVDTIRQLGELLDRASDDVRLRVIAFRSDNPGFFMAHWDLPADKMRVARRSRARPGCIPVSTIWCG